MFLTISPHFSQLLYSSLQVSLKFAGKKGVSSWLSNPWNVMVFLSTRVIFVKLLLFNMFGLLRIFLQVVPVVEPCNSIEHDALSCPNGAFPSLSQSRLQYRPQDLTAELMSKVCHDVSTEPSLQPLCGESLSLLSIH